MAKPSQVRIGDRVRDTINGFKGIATGRTEYINGCRQFLVKPEGLDKDGKPIDGIWLDEQNLVVVDAQILTEPFPLRGAVATGGPDRHERAV